jgi:hypothetical protein
MAIEWTTNYSVTRARIGRIGDLVVAWGSSQKTAPGYEVSAFGVTLKENSPNEEDGKRRAVALAKRLLADANATMTEST